MSKPKSPVPPSPTPAQTPPAAPTPPTPRYEPLRLKIQPVIAVAEELTARVKSELPGHDGLAAAAAGVVAAAHRAQQVSRSMKRAFSIHKLPAYFLATALLALCGWVYWQFVHVSTLRLALPDRDATALRERVSGDRVHFRAVTTPGSREAVEMVAAGQVDLAFVQGGIGIPRELPRLETPTPEIVLWLLRDHIQSPRDVRRMLTSLAGEGSHSVAQVFVEAWRIQGQVTYSHDWRELTTDPNYQIADEIDAVFVVKDPLDEKSAAGLARLLAAGFRLESPDIGARATAYDYLNPTTLARGYLQPSPPVPAETIATYSVPTFLVARSNLTPRLFNEAAHVLELRPPSIKDKEFTPTTADASDLFQGIEAFMGILINIVLVFLALLGLDMWTYRKQLHELNSVISLLSVLQSNKDVLGLKNDKQKAENLLYLSLVSDLLGVISMISSYYTQENSSLLFNNLSEVIHQRCDGLKINIQLKILHATVAIP